MSKKNNDIDKNKNLKIIRNNKTIGKGSAEPLLKEVKIQKSGDSNSQPSLFVFTLYFIYKNLYLIGATLLRRKRKYFKKSKLLFFRTKGLFFAWIFDIGNILVRFKNRVVNQAKAPFLRIGNVYAEQKPIIKSKKQQNKLPLDSYLQIIESVFRLILHIIATLLNYIAPVFAVVVLVFLVSSFVNQSFGLEVTYEGEQIGYIKSESDFEAASRDVKSRLIYGGRSYSTSVPSFELVVFSNPDDSGIWLDTYYKLLQAAGLKLVDHVEFTSVTDLATSIIESSEGEIEKAYGFYIDNILYGAVKDKDIILDELEALKKIASSGKPDERSEFQKKIALEPQLYPAASIVDEQVIIDRINSLETVEQIYIVVQGDSPTGIADKHGIPYATLLEMNRDRDIESSLPIGAEVKTAVAKPFLPVKVIFTDVYEEEIPYETITSQNAIYARNYSEVTQEGVVGLREVTAEITTVNGIEIERRELNSLALKDPVPEKITLGVGATPQPSQPSAQGASPAPQNAVISGGNVSQSGFIWPISSGYLSAWVGSYRGHTGIDIAGPVGAPIYASASGVVTKAQYSYVGYGIHLKINHGNGYETLYAHCNELYVKVGDYVEQGQVIAARGSTGNSSGPHLHFEIIKNGSIQNPLNYVSR